MKWPHSLCGALSVAAILGLGTPCQASPNTDVSITCRNIPVQECIKSVEGAYSVSVFLNANIEQANISVDVRHQDALHAVMSVLDTLEKSNYAVLSENEGKRYRVTVFGQGTPNAPMMAAIPVSPDTGPEHREDGNTVGSKDDAASEGTAEAAAQPQANAADAGPEAGFIPKEQDAPATAETAQPEMPISAFRQASADLTPPVPVRLPDDVLAPQDKAANETASPDDDGDEEADAPQAAEVAAPAPS